MPDFMDLGSWHEVARRCGASKVEHTYMRHYERLLWWLYQRPISLLEIGVCNGGSIKTWLELFPNAYVYGVDVKNDTPWLTGRCEGRVCIFLCDQANPALATLFPPESLDVVIDDGSHVFADQTKARESLWPALKPGGWYFVEDILNLNDLKYWATFSRFRVFTDFMRRLDGERMSTDDVLVALRKEPCPLPWEW